MTHKEKIITILRDSDNTSDLNTSVIFENILTGKLYFANGITHNFEFISDALFDELREEKIIIRQKCRCQGDVRYIANPDVIYNIDIENKTKKITLEQASNQINARKHFTVLSIDKSKRICYFLISENVEDNYTFNYSKRSGFCSDLELSGDIFYSFYSYKFFADDNRVYFDKILEKHPKSTIVNAIEADLLNKLKDNNTTFLLSDGNIYDVLRNGTGVFVIIKER